MHYTYLIWNSPLIILYSRVLALLVMLQNFPWQWLLLFSWYEKLFLYLCAKHTFVSFKYKAVVNSRTYLNIKHWLWRTDTWKLLAEAKNENEDQQAQQNTCKGQTELSSNKLQYWKHTEKNFMEYFEFNHSCFSHHSTDNRSKFLLTSYHCKKTGKSCSWEKRWRKVLWEIMSPSTQVVN